MDAIQLKVSETAPNKFGKTAMPDGDLCLGCGVCVHKCPTGSLTLERNEEVAEPPKTIREYTMRFMEDKQAGVKLLRRTSDE